MKNLSLIVATFFVLFHTSNVLAQTDWSVDNYNISFKIKNAGFNVHGSFKGLKYKIKFDENSNKNIIETSLDASTVNTNNNARDRHLKKDDYFGVEKNPRITLNSVSFTKINDQKYTGTFKLSIKGITKTVTMPITFKNNGNKATLTGELIINRLDYGVGSKSWVLGNEVTLNLSAELSK
jgi:polyisoprenoid-binding protein YceI